jgi:hypothetical protein
MSLWKRKLVLSCIRAAHHPAHAGLMVPEMSITSAGRIWTECREETGWEEQVHTALGTSEAICLGVVVSVTFNMSTIIAHGTSKTTA